MRRDKLKYETEKRLNSQSWRDTQVLNSKGLHRGTVIRVDGVRYMKELYNHKLAQGIKDEDNKFPSPTPTVTIK